MLTDLRKGPEINDLLRMSGNLKDRNSLFESLEKDGNEIFSDRGRQEAHFHKCLEVFARKGPEELSLRQAYIERATDDLDLHADRIQIQPEKASTFSMDLFPRIIRPKEWERIQIGVLQRVMAFGQFIRDIHTRKEILRSGLLPPEIVFEDPAFHPELHEVPMSEGCPITLGAVDLIRTVSGEWQVLENRFSSPTGISYVIQIRRILAQAFPELFEHIPVFPVAAFASRLSEALADCLPSAHGRRPLVVLLSEGDTGRHFFEESFLARHMGIPLSRPADFVVREGRVFLKTIEGLHPVDVIYRRIEPAQLDPVAFANANEQGIPGLIQCIRRGTVKVINSVGCAVADNRALLRHADEIIRYYTGNQPILRTVQTFHGFDQDQADWVREHPDSLLLKTVCHPETLKRVDPTAGQLSEKGDLVGLMRRDPRFIVAQELPPSSRLPVYDGKEALLQKMVLRVFCITGRRPYILPGGLTRVFQTGNEFSTTGKRSYVFKDTWALRQKQVGGDRGKRLEPEIDARDTPVTSRAAEAFFWIGRYLERGRGTARMLNTLDELRWSELAPGERELYSPLWRGFLKATGDESGPGAGIPSDTGKLTRRLVFDGTNPASVNACFAAVRSNAQSIRSSITPEFWRSIHRTSEYLVSAGNGSLKGVRLRELMEVLVDSGDQIYGTAHRTLLQDAGWHFLNIGISLERGINHLIILGEVLPHIAERQWQHFRNDTDLTALLRLLGALDAYHRKYRSRAYLDRVVQLLWTAPTCPASVFFAAEAIHADLKALEREAGLTTTSDLLEETRQFTLWLSALPLSRIFPARALELDGGVTRKNLTAKATIDEMEKCLKHMQGFFDRMNIRLEDRFFSHHPQGKGEGLP